MSLSVTESDTRRYTDLKGNRVGLNTSKISNYFHLRALLGGFINIYTQDFFSSKLRMFVQCFQMRSRKRLAPDILDTFAMHAGFVNDVSATDYWAEMAAGRH